MYVYVYTNYTFTYMHTIIYVYDYNSCVIIALQGMCLDCVKSEVF